MAPEASTTVQPAAAAHPHFVEMVSAIPVIASALGIAKHVYDTTKTRYEVVGKVEREIVDHLVPQVVSATTKATPQSAQHLLSSGLSQLDHYACNGLDLLEKKVPIIMEPAPKIIETGKKLVDERIITPVDQLVEKALGFSEATVDQLLPAPASSGEAEPAENEGALSDESPNKLARAQKLGVEVSKRLTQRATEQYEAIKKVTPNDVQKFVSVDVVRLASANAEKQLAWLKESLDSVLRVIHKEDVHIRKLVETYTAELKASFTQALERIEKVTPATVKETTSAVLATLAKSLNDFVDNFKKITAPLALHPTVAADPYLKKLLETVNSSIATFQTYAQSLSHLALFQKLMPASPTAASTTPADESK